MSKPRYQKPTTPVTERLRKEPVELDGGEVWVWELTSLEMLELGERSARPAIDPRGGVDNRMAAAMLTKLSVHYGPEADSPRVWDDLTYEEIFDLRGEEFTRLQEAIGRVMGTAPSEVEARRDFSLAPAAPSTSESTLSASNNSTGSPPKSMSPITS
jgi:hypothetical protein